MKKEITLIGYGNQGKAWAANLRDSGWRVQVSGRPDGEGMKAAWADGFPLLRPEELPAYSGLISLLLPDEMIPRFFSRYFAEPVGAAKKEGRSFLFAHGFSVVYGNLPFAAKDDVILVAPKGIGTKLRENYKAGSGVLGVLGVERDVSGKAWEKAKLVADGLGLTRVGVIDSSFTEETKADLLSEQAILCGSVPLLVEESVKFLVNKGVNPRIATYECLNELKLIVDMMVAQGINGMYQRVSTAARYGGLLAADTILPKAELQSRLEILWQNIESGNFAKSLLDDSQIGHPAIKEKLAHFKDCVVDQHREKEKA